MFHYIFWLMTNLEHRCSFALFEIEPLHLKLNVRYAISSFFLSLFFLGEKERDPSTSINQVQIFEDAPSKNWTLNPWLQSSGVWPLVYAPVSEDELLNCSKVCQSHVKWIMTYMVPVIFGSLQLGPIQTTINVHHVICSFMRTANMNSSLHGMPWFLVFWFDTSKNLGCSWLNLSVLLNSHLNFHGCLFPPLVFLAWHFLHYTKLNNVHYFW